MLFSALFPVLALLLLPPSAIAEISLRRPHARSYDTHQYYTLELDSSASTSLAEAVSSSLGVELVEPLGELAGHWLVRREGSTPHSHEPHSRSLTSDPVVTRWRSIKRSAARRRDSSSSTSELRSLTPLHLRKRSKRESHLPMLARRPLQGAGPGYHPSRQDDKELLFAQNDLHLVDPMLNQQWHLINTELPEVELNVTGVWATGNHGEGVKVVIVDDGLDMHSDDLKDNFYPDGSYDFNDHTELPEPRLSDDQHGTRCAGEIAAAPNDVCGVGVAYSAKIAGVRILSAPISDADEAAALNYAYQLNEIYSCSWGPPDDGKSMEAPEGVILKALVNGVQNGRDGKGSIFVFAAGNGGGMDDQCNFDGYTNSIFSITVGAVDRKGLHPYYSEQCAAMMMVAPSSGSGDHIHTTDVGKDKCAHTHGGTSAAAPLAAGLFALALKVRPELTWRDFQHIAVRNSVFFAPDDPTWEKTSVGRQFSYKYGYGRADAGRFVEAAQTWPLVKPQAWFDSPAVYLPLTNPPATDAGRKKRQDDTESETEGGGDDGEIPTAGETEPEPVAIPEPQGSFLTTDGVSSTFEVTSQMLQDSNLETLEHVTVRVWIEHQRRGDVEVQLTSPNGIMSVLARQRRFDEADSGFPGWKFMSLKHWEENPIGTWTIKVTDAANPEKTGRFIAWSLQLWGECIDASAARLWAPAEEGEPDEEETGSEATATYSQKPKPTEHLPGDHGSATGETDQPGIALPTPQPGGGSDEDITEPGEGDEDEHIDEGWFSGIESLNSSSAWIAGAGMLVVLAGAGTGAFFFFRARRRNRNPFGLANNGEGARGAYQPVSDDVPMGILDRGRRKLGMGGRGGQGAGSKDLYDAFGEESDEESDDDAGERTALRYHDDFLEDDHDHDLPPREADAQTPQYRDEPEEHTEPHQAVEEPEHDDDGEKRQRVKRDEAGGESASGSSGSWQDAAEEVSVSR